MDFQQWFRVLETKSKNTLTREAKTWLLKEIKESVKVRSLVQILKSTESIPETMMIIKEEVGTTQRLIEDSIRELGNLDLPGMVGRRKISIKYQIEGCVLTRSIFFSFRKKYLEMSEELMEMLKSHVLQFEWRKKLKGLAGHGDDPGDGEPHAGRDGDPLEPRSEFHETNHTHHRRGRRQHSSKVRNNSGRNHQHEEMEYKIKVIYFKIKNALD